MLVRAFILNLFFYLLLLYKKIFHSIKKKHDEIPVRTLPGYNKVEKGKMVIYKI